MNARHLLFITTLAAGCIAPRSVALPRPPAIPAPASDAAPRFWFGVMIVGFPVEGAAPKVAFLSFTKQEVEKKEIDMRAAGEKALVREGTEILGYWRFDPPPNPVFKEVRLYKDGRIRGVLPLDAEGKCRLLIAPKRPLASSPSGDAPVTMGGVTGWMRWLIPDPAMVDTVEGASCPDPRRPFSPPLQLTPASL